MDLVQLLKDAHAFLSDCNFPIGIAFLGFLQALILIWFYLFSYREDKILRYFQIADTTENELDHHGEAVTLRVRLKMTHEEIMQRARKILERRAKLLHNKPA